MSLRYLFIDMNAYFASVEQQFQPELRGKPVGVVPVMAETTCCIAASYEAKRFGVKTGTMVAEARALCPGIHIVEARPRLYVEVHHQILKAIDTYLPIAAVLSIDEMVCRLLKNEQEPAQAIALAKAIKQAIKEQIGPCLRSSIGLGPNRMLAKVASDMQKPDGLTVIELKDLPERLYGLKLTSLPGIGDRMNKRLARQGITSIEKLYRLSPGEMAKVWGSKVLGYAWWKKLRGEDVPETPTHRHSVSHSHVLPPALRNRGGAKAVLIRLVHRAATRLRHMGYCADSVGIGIKLVDGPGWHEQERIPPCQDTITFIRHALSLWEKMPSGTPLRIGVWLGGLTPDQNVPWPLFEKEQKLARLAKAMDKVSRKYGGDSLYFAGMQRTDPKSSSRIAFNYIPDLSIPEI